MASFLEELVVRKRGLQQAARHYAKKFDCNYTHALRVMKEDLENSLANSNKPYYLHVLEEKRAEDHENVNGLPRRALQE